MTSEGTWSQPTSTSFTKPIGSVSGVKAPSPSTSTNATKAVTPSVSLPLSGRASEISRFFVWSVGICVWYMMRRKCCGTTTLLPAMKYILRSLTSRSKSPVTRSIEPTRLLNSVRCPFIELSTEAILRAYSPSCVPPWPDPKMSSHVNACAATLQALP